MGKNQDQVMLKIGELARRLRLNVRTLRYYERIGLLPRPTRTESGYRLYSAADEQLLHFVLQAKAVGLRLAEIQRIIELRKHGLPCGYVRETLAQHIADIDAQIADLQRFRTALVAAAATSDQKGAAVGGRFCGLIERWSELAPITNQETLMKQGRRNVEVFTAGCPLCDPVVELVQRIACPSCDVTVYNLKDDSKAAERAKAMGVHRLPMVLVDGKPAECCQSGPVTEAGLRAAGIGTA